MQPDKPLHLDQLTPDELFDVLGLSDMDHDERLRFLHHMSAWSHATIPAPNQWWMKAALVAHNWRTQLDWHVDQLIEQALGTETHG